MYETLGQRFVVPDQNRILRIQRITHPFACVIRLWVYASITQVEMKIKDETRPTRLREAVTTNPFKCDLWRNARQAQHDLEDVHRGYLIALKLPSY